jgi:hypothetical protein
LNVGGDTETIDPVDKSCGTHRSNSARNGRGNFADGWRWKAGLYRIQFKDEGQSTGSEKGMEREGLVWEWMEEGVQNGSGERIFLRVRGLGLKKNFDLPNKNRKLNN